MKILLIGGSGTISTSVSKEIIKQGHELYVLNRGNGNDELPSEAHILIGDMSQEAVISKLLDGMTFDVVADFIAFETKQVEMDYRLFQGKTSQYVFISSASIYQKPLRNYFVTESTPRHNPYWQYSRNKIACEDALMIHYRQDGFPVTIVRPSHTYDNRSVPMAVHGDNGTYSVINRMLCGKSVPIHGDGCSLWTFTHAEDFARGFVGLLGNSQAIGEAVQITSDQSITWNTAYDIIATILGVKCNPLYMTSEMLAIQGKSMGYDFRGSIMGDKAHSVVFDNSKLKRLVPGFTATCRFETGVADTIRYITDHPAYQFTDATFDRFCDHLEKITEQMSENLV
jgi:nucleoside-diphosphate-sugar epimerase